MRHKDGIDTSSVGEPRMVALAERYGNIGRTPIIATKNIFATTVVRAALRENPHSNTERVRIWSSKVLRNDLLDGRS